MAPGDQRPSSRKPSAWLWGLLALALTFGWFLLMQETSRPGAAPAPVAEPAGRIASPKPVAVAAATGLPTGDADPVFRNIVAAGEEIAELAARLSPGRNLEGDAALLDEIRRKLGELAAKLRALPNDRVATAIAAYLDSGKDVITGLGFKVGEGGLLSDAPSMRMFLLDLFADIDAPVAVDYSIGLLEGSDAPGEWALALRNIAWQDGQGNHRELLRERLSRLLDRQDWLVSPDQGFLEAFDVAVHLGDEVALREMGSVLGLRDARGQLANNGVTHAAFLAMDRLTAADPGQTVGLIQSDREFLAWAPRHRGALMSRADVRDPLQAAGAGEYLLRADVGEEERHAFLQLFPNPNGVLADSLISPPATPLEFSDGLDRDRAALAWVRGRLSDPRFAGLRTALLATEARLAGFVSAGEGGGAGR